MKLYERIENNNFDEIDKNRAIELIEGGNGHLVYNEGYFKLQKENKELKKQVKSDVNTIYNNYLEKLDEYERNTIPIQRIKDIIDRIDYDIKKTKEIISKNTNIYASYRKNDYQIVRLRAMNTKSLDIKKRLQELLDGSDTDVGSIESEE